MKGTKRLDEGGEIQKQVQGKKEGPPVRFRLLGKKKTAANSAVHAASTAVQQQARLAVDAAVVCLGRAPTEP